MIGAAGALFAAIVAAYVVWQQIQIGLYGREEDRIEARLPGLREVQQAALYCIHYVEQLVPLLTTEVTATDAPPTSTIYPKAQGIILTARTQIEGEFPNVSAQMRLGFLATFNHLTDAARVAVEARGDAGSAKTALQQAGKAYLYFRMADGALVPLPLDQSSPEFRRAYDDCSGTRQKLANTAPKLPDRKSIDASNVRFIGDTVGRAIKVYKESADFRSNKVTSQKKYDRWLAILNEKLGTTRLRDLDVNHVDVYSDLIATEMSPSNARFQIAMISNVWEACKKLKEFGLAKLPNPTIGTVRRYKVKTPHQPWSDDLQDKFMQLAPERLKLAKLLLHFSAQRGGDCVRMQIKDFDGQGLWVRPEKTSDGTDLAPNYHLCPEPLRKALETRSLESGSPKEFLLLNERGRQWASANSLSCSIRDFMVKVGLRQKGSKEKPVRGPSMHGLRKNAASEVAALLVGTQGIKSVTGHKSDDQAAYYARHAAQIALNRQVVERWNEAVTQKQQDRVGRRRSKIRRVK